MDKILIIVCAVVGSLGVLSAIFGFSAEGSKRTRDDIRVDPVDGECIYPEKPALGLAISAVIFLLLAQVTITAVARRNKPRTKPSETKRIVSIVCAVASWIAAAVAFALFIDGAKLNANVVQPGQVLFYDYEPLIYCPYDHLIKDGIFAGAAVLSLAATALGVTSYVLMRTQRVRAAAPPPQVAPAEGKPKPPPAATDQGSNGSPQNQEVQDPSADTTTPPPAAMASAPPEPAGQPTTTPAAGTGTGTEMGQQTPVQLPQVVVPIDTIQYSIHQQQQAQGSDDFIRKELTKAGIRLAGKVVEHALFSDSIGVGDMLASMTDHQSTEDV